MTDRRMGMWYEELPVGTVVRHAITRTLTETDNVLFTTMSMNPQPLHLDAEFAAKTQFGRPLVNSLFTLALTVGISVPELHPRHDGGQPRLLDRGVPRPGLRGRHDPR